MQHLSGTRGSVDFVELPSHLFEYYVLDPDAVKHLLLNSKGTKISIGFMHCLSFFLSRRSGLRVSLSAFVVFAVAAPGRG